MKKFLIKFKEYDDNGVMAYRFMEILADTKESSKEKFWNIWNGADVDIIKVIEI